MLLWLFAQMLCHVFKIALFWLTVTVNLDKSVIRQLNLYIVLLQSKNDTVKLCNALFGHLSTAVSFWQAHCYILFHVHIHLRKPLLVLSGKGNDFLQIIKYQFFPRSQLGWNKSQHIYTLFIILKQM